MLRDIAHRLLDKPLVFQLQQRICNNYLSLKDTFPAYFGVTGNNILDIGCSTATCAGQIIDMKNNYYVGVDIDPKYVVLAKEMHLHGHFLLQDTLSLTFVKIFFDFVNIY